MEFGTIDVILSIFLAVMVAYAAKLFNKAESPSSPAKKPAHLVNGAKSTQSTTAIDKDEVPTILFLFGSESGTAENFAFDVAEEAPIYGFKSRVLSLDEFSPHEFENEKFIVYIAATHGEGEPCSNSQTFWDEWVTKDAEERDSNELSHLTYSVFGLGNRQYRHFNAVAKRIDQEMALAKAERLIPCQLGDDDGTMEEDMDKWRSDFWAAARIRFLSADAASVDLASQPAFNATYDVTIYPQQSDHVKGYVSGLEKVARYFNDPVKEHRTGIVTVTKAVELRQAKDDCLESTAHVELSLADTKLTYRTADNLGVHPRNDYKTAGKLAKRCGVDMKTIFSAKGSNANRRVPMPNPCSVEDAFLYFLDIHSIPKHKFASIFATYAKDEKEKAKLSYFANDSKGKEEFHNARYNWGDLLEAFPSIDVPFAHLLEMIPRLQPRYYTISSSSKTDPKTVSVTVTRLFSTKPHNGQEFKGVASDFLCNSIDDTNNHKMVVFVRQSLFRLPHRAGTPIIMIGPGTGLAPFRGFVREFSTRAKEHKFGDTVLFFGCRHPEKDYIYREELEKAKEDGLLTDLCVAYSRVPGQPKVYVQQLVKQQAERMWDLIEKGAYIYVCGGTAMGRDVLDVFRNLVSQYGKYSPSDAEIFVDKLIRQNRYVQELWSAN
jgi:NADPH-ferrihemoprotein reductase